jgi:nicotinamidase-related amidase
VLVVVDAQHGFLGEAGAAAVERIVWLVAVARRLGIPVIVTEEEPDVHGPTDERIASQLPDGARAFRKPTFGLAGTPEVLAAVQETGRRVAVLVGAETDVCVAQSAIGLRAAGFTCVLVEDATFSPGELHERGLARAADAGVSRNHTKGVTYEWLRTVDDAHALSADESMPARPY